MDYNHQRPHGSLGHLTPVEFTTQRQEQRTEKSPYSSAELPTNGTKVTRSVGVVPNQFL